MLSNNVSDLSEYLSIYICLLLLAYCIEFEPPIGKYNYMNGLLGPIFYFEFLINFQSFKICEKFQIIIY